MDARWIATPFGNSGTVKINLNVLVGQFSMADWEGSPQRDSPTSFIEG
jgi:hypothetical protein